MQTQVSQKKLDKLDNWEYNEYQTLSEIDFDGKKYETLCFIILHLFLCLVFAVLLTSTTTVFYAEWYKDALIIFGISAVCFPISIIPTFLLVEIFKLEDFYTKTYQHFSHQTESYLRLKNLETHFNSILLDIESEAISILSNIEKETQIRLSDNRNINNYLHRKRNPHLYSTDIKKAQSNYELNQKALVIFDANIPHIKFNIARQKELEKIQTDLKYEDRYFTGLLAVSLMFYDRGLKPNNAIKKEQKPVIKSSLFSSKKDSPKRGWFFNNKKDRGSISAEPLGISNDYSSLKDKNNQPASNSSLDKQDTSQKTSQNKTSFVDGTIKNIIELPASSINEFNEKNVQLNLHFSSPNVTLKATEDIPKKRKTPKYEPIIKASPKFYTELLNKKIEIGLQGELLVMEHERQRLIEQSQDFSKLRHISHEDGDGFGYDILSLDDSKEIYIEVKTTTGSFWANLFFTENEFNKMNEFGEQYYLYRICNFDLKSGAGNLFIFPGREMIVSYFDFKSRMYVLTEKEVNVSNT